MKAKKNNIKWEEHEIEFIPVASHRTFWAATINELWFDGIMVATSGGFCLSSTARATIDHRGQQVSTEVRSSTWSGRDLKYQLLINGVVISKGYAKIRYRL